MAAAECSTVFLYEWVQWNRFNKVEYLEYLGMDPYATGLLAYYASERAWDRALSMYDTEWNDWESNWFVWVPETHYNASYKSGTLY